MGSLWLQLTTRWPDGLWRLASWPLISFKSSEQPCIPSRKSKCKHVCQKQAATNIIPRKLLTRELAPDPELPLCLYGQFATTRCRGFGVRKNETSTSAACEILFNIMMILFSNQDFHLPCRSLPLYHYPAPPLEAPHSTKIFALSCIFCSQTLILRIAGEGEPVVDGRLCPAWSHSFY